MEENSIIITTEHGEIEIVKKLHTNTTNMKEDEEDFYRFLSNIILKNIEDFQN
jgi:hypothetical protein